MQMSGAGARRLAAGSILVGLAVLGLKGLAAWATLRQQIALCEGKRTVTVRHQRMIHAQQVTMRGSRRPLRPVVAAPVRLPQRAAA